MPKPFPRSPNHPPHTRERSQEPPQTHGRTQTHGHLHARPSPGKGHLLSAPHHRHHSGSQTSPGGFQPPWRRNHLSPVPGRPGTALSPPGTKCPPRGTAGAAAQPPLPPRSPASGSGSREAHGEQLFKSCFQTSKASLGFSNKQTYHRTEEKV